MMALTDENTVLILGAGVSVPFGLPTGASLIDDIAKNLQKQLKNYFSGESYYFSENKLLPTNDCKTFLLYPYLQPLLWKVGLEKRNKEREYFLHKLKQELETMQELVRLLNNQTSDSIDDFIVLNPSFSEHVKLCIAAEFIQALYVQEERRSVLKLSGIEERYLFDQDRKFDKKHKPERNWIHRLINLIRLGVSKGNVTPENKIQIITFNYDTILERVLAQQFSNFEGMSSDENTYQDYVEITHVHGQCGTLEDEMVVPGKVCWEWAKGIKVIREDQDLIDGSVRNARKHARSIVGKAKEIYACGFAFAKANTDLIGLIPKNRRYGIISYCNFGNDVGLTNAANKFRHSHRQDRSIVYTDIVEQSGIGVSDWIGVGTLGELP